MPLYLVDGHALAYRSYYAFIRRPLVNSKGEETSAVFGFLKTLLSLLDKFEPSHVAVVFDSAEVTFRKEMFEAYKAQRPKMPDSLSGQFPRIMELLDAMAIPTLSQNGYEADDIIATLAKQMESAVPVRIISGDKDLFQVVTDKTHVIRPGKGGLLGEELDPEGVQKTFGLRPDQFRDYQALMGDPTDNVPGVPGVGEKTALKLIQDYGSLDGVYDNIDRIESKTLRRKLVDGKDKALLSRDLVRLDPAVPVEVMMDDLRRRSFDAPRLRVLLRELEFMQVLDTLGLPPDEDACGPDVAYHTVESAETLRELASTLRRADAFAVDTESSGLDPFLAVLAGISVAVEEGEAWYVPVQSVIDEAQDLLTPPRIAPGLPLVDVRRELGPILQDATKAKIGQNIKYDTIVLRNAGFPLDGIAFDTMLASYCLHPARRSHGLDAMAEEVFGHRMIPFKSLFDGRAKKKDIRTVSLKKAVEYACEDADYTLRLKNYFEPMLRASQVNELFYDVEMPLSGVLTGMEMYGVAVDTVFLGAMSKKVGARMEELERSIYDLTGESFNIQSTARLQDILFKKLGLKPSHKTKTGFSTDVDVLKSLSSQHEVPNLVLEYRMLSKLKGTYIDALPKLVNPRTGRVHTSYNQAVTSTGRLSSSDPNLQNIPIRGERGREVRKAFIASADDWVLLDADYSQIELRIMAHLSGDAELVSAFEEDADVHKRTAARIMGVEPDEVSDAMRARAKTVNFGIIYGMGPRGLAQSLDIDIAEAKQFIRDYFDKYPGVRRFVDETIAKAKREKAVSTLLGRVRQLPDITSPDNRARSFAERTAVNTVIQGTAADIIKVAMVKVDRRLRREGLRGRMILQVHDELLFDLPADELAVVRNIVRDAMENAVELGVALKVDMASGRNWLETHG